jgi:DNA-binding transcriptional LysR family regulator
VLNPVHLRTLLVVMRTGSFADAGRRLGYTGSAISQQMSALEADLQTRLFERDARSVTPTAAARFIAQRAAAALGSMQELEQAISAYDGGRAGLLRIGSFPTASQHLVPAALSSLRQHSPELEVRLEEGEPDQLMKLLEARELDMVIIFKYGRNSLNLQRGLEGTKLLEEELRVVLPAEHRLAGLDRVRIEQLADETWVTTQDRTAMSAILLSVCHGAGFDPSISFRSNDYNVVQALVAAGLGIALVPALAQTSSEQLVSRRIHDEAAPRRSTWSVHAKPMSPPAAQLAIDALRSSTRAQAAQTAGLHAAGSSPPRSAVSGRRAGSASTPRSGALTVPGWAAGTTASNGVD